MVGCGWMCPERLEYNNKADVSRILFPQLSVAQAFSSEAQIHAVGKRFVKSELTYFLKYLFGSDRAGRNLAVFPDDTFIVSFPRSGNTWTRFLVANLVHTENPVTFVNIERVVPDIHAHSRRYLKSVPRPRILKSHEYFDPRYKRLLYIVRDPRDVAVSSYHFHLKQRQIEEGYPIVRYVSDFVAGTVWSSYGSWGQNVSTWLITHRNPTRPHGIPAEKERAFGTWGENVTSWLAARENTNEFLMLRYEDMVEDPHGQLSRVASLLNIEATPERIARSVELSNADHMRKLEKTEGSKWQMTKSTRKDIPFVRNAVRDGWKSALPSESVAQIESAWGSIMTQLGYELSTTPCLAR